MASWKVFLLAGALDLHIALNCSLGEVKSISPSLLEAVSWKMAGQGEGQNNICIRQNTNAVGIKINSLLYEIWSRYEIQEAQQKIQFTCIAKYNLHSSLAPIGPVYNIRATFLPTKFLRQGQQGHHQRKSCSYKPCITRTWVCTVHHCAPLYTTAVNCAVHNALWAICGVKLQTEENTIMIQIKFLI